MSIHQLKNVALFERKLETSELGFVEQNPVGFRAIFSAHFIDFWMVLTGTVYVKLVMELFLSQYMVTPSMRASFQDMNSALVAACLFPMMLTSYFFFCFFFNHGQTFGMNRMKIRVEMREHDFLDSYHWSVYSLKVAMSLGLFALLSEENPYRAHDYLYGKMMTQKEDIAPSLTELLPEEMVEFPQEEFQRAA